MSSVVAKVASQAFYEVAASPLWEAIIPYLRPALQLVGITVPATLPTLNLTTDYGRRLDQQIQDFFISMYDQSGIVWQLVVRPAIAQIVQQITLNLPTIGSLSLAIREAITNFFANEPLVIAQLVAAINQALPGALGRVSDVFTSTINQLLQIILNYSWEYFYPILTNTIDALGYLGTIINEYLIPIRTNLDLALQNIGNLVRDNLPEIIDAINEGVADALASLRDFVNTGIGAVNQIVNQTLTELGELEYFISTEFKFWVGEASEYIINSLRGVQQDGAMLFDFLNQVEVRIEGAIGGIATQAQTYYTDLSQKIDYTFAMLPQQVADGFGGIWTSFKTDIANPAIADVNNWFAGIADRFRGLFGAIGCEAQGVSDWFGGLFKQISDWIQSLCGKECQRDLSQALPDPFNMITRTLTSVLGAGGGLGLSLTLGELIHPLKSLGLSRLAAYVWDMADFKTVGGGVIGALNSASTLRPLQYGLNEFFRPNLPTIEDETKWFFRINSPIENVQLSLRRHGFADAYIEKYIQDIYQPISQRVVLNMIETPGIELDWIRDVLKAHGVSPADREVLINYARRKRLSDEFSELKAAYESAYIAGYVDRETYGLQLESIGKTDDEVRWGIYAADRKEETARLKEAIDIIVSAFRAGNLSQPSFEDEIMLLPLVPAKAQNLIEKELARKRITATTQRALKQAKLSVAEILKGFDYDMFNENGVLERLLALNYTLEDANLILLVHKSELAAKLADDTTKAAAKAELDAAREEQRLALEWARFLTNAIIYRSISPDNAKELIFALPLSDARKNLFYQEIDINASRPAGEGSADKPKTLREADVYKSLSYALITYQDAIDYLTAKGYAAEEAALLIQLNSPESVPIA